MAARMHAEEIDVDERLVRRLLRAQFPDLAELPLTIVQPWGTDNAIWRLGAELVVRIPRIGWAAGQAAAEARWLPEIGPHLPVAVPEPVAVGRPADGCPHPWAVHRWLPGEAAELAGIEDPMRFAGDLAAVVRALEMIAIDGAPEARGRARPLREYHEATLAAIDGASHLIDAGAARRVWEEALAAPAHRGDPVWVHGDLEGNCLVSDGRLSGIVDWSSACAGDPAVDVQVVWSPLFSDESRRAFLEDLGIDAATVARSRGVAVQQACLALPYYLETYPLIVTRSWHKLAALGIARRPGVI